MAKKTTNPMIQALQKDKKATAALKKAMNAPSPMRKAFKVTKVANVKQATFKAFTAIAKGGDGGVLCFVVKMPYKGKGKPVLILHEAKVSPEGGAFGYGAWRHWVVK